MALVYIRYVAERSDHRTDLLLSQLCRLTWLGRWPGRSWRIRLRHTRDRSEHENLNFIVLDHWLGGPLSDRQRTFIYWVLYYHIHVFQVFRRVWHILHDDVFGIDLLCAYTVHLHVRAGRSWLAISDRLYRRLVQREKEERRASTRNQKEVK